MDESTRVDPSGGAALDQGGVYHGSRVYFRAETLKLIGFYGKHSHSVEDRNCYAAQGVVK